MNNLQPWLSESPNNNDIYNVNLNNKSPEINKSIYDNRNKYFDTFKFNKDFENYIEKQDKIKLQKQKFKFKDLENIENIEIKPYNLSIKQIAINIQNSLLKLIQFNLKSLNFNDVFYYALFIISVGIIYSILFNLIHQI